jgi:hypothetical protein
MATRSGSMIGRRGTPFLAVNSTPFTRMSACRMSVRSASR